MTDEREDPLLHLLVVEDDAATLQVTLKHFSARGWRVTTARESIEALRAVRESTPDAVLTDVSLPGMNGIVLREVLSAVWPGLPVVLMTAYPRYSVPGGVPPGVALIEKPLDWESVSETIRRLIREARA